MVFQIQESTGQGWYPAIGKKSRQKFEFQTLESALINTLKYFRYKNVRIIDTEKKEIAWPK